LLSKAILPVTEDRLMGAVLEITMHQVTLVNLDDRRSRVGEHRDDLSESCGDSPLNDLLVATARADRRAFAELYQRTSSRLFAIALRIMRRRELAEEVLQDAYMSIWERAGQQSRARGSVLGWMVAIVRHRAIDRIRAQAETREVSVVDDTAEADWDLASFTDEPSVNPTSAIQSCLEMLPHNQRQAVLYAFYYGFTHEELAQQLGVPLGTAKSWVRRGLMRLRTLLEQ
jgi:RNA polymerase sigma-70 factor (ECF subfamily)